MVAACTYSSRRKAANTGVTAIVLPARIAPLPLGVYNKISLREARQRHRDAQSLLNRGIDPLVHKREQRQVKARQASFERIAREWYAHQKPAWKNAQHVQQVIGSLERYAFPGIGKKGMDSILPTDILAILNAMNDKPETASRVKQRISAVFDFAIQTGRATHNPAAAAPKIVRSADKRVKHHPKPACRRNRHVPAQPGRIPQP